ncbi:MAG: peptidoglycan DD-metalloendopeptidase family protein [Holophaga sp.]|nr:peptidoglycan DD-metalloendopeptidase family protein [Holophaga sp.]
MILPSRKGAKCNSGATALSQGSNIDTGFARRIAIGKTCMLPVAQILRFKLAGRLLQLGREMSAMAVPILRARTKDSAVSLQQPSQSPSFRDLLRSINKPDSGVQRPTSTTASQPATWSKSTLTVVRPGDTLSQICAAQLKKSGGEVSRREILDAVQRVAMVNEIADPNRIYTGQKLDLSLLTKYVSRQETPEARVVPENAKQWESLVENAIGTSSEFGLRKDPFTGRNKHHGGVDVLAPAGASISSLAAGSVIFAGWKPGYGNTVIIRHEDGLESLYGHLSKSLVHVGDQVASHTTIACVGSTGRSTGPHLHFEVRKNGQVLDPRRIV